MIENKKNLIQGSIVLLITDDPVSSYLLPMQMEYSGVLMIDTQRTETAVELLNMHTDIKMVLIDLPLIDALESVNMLREHHAFDFLPIIVLGYHEIKEYHLACIETGANDYAVKNLDIRPLVDLMNNHLYLNDLSREDAPIDDYHLNFQGGQVTLLNSKGQTH